MTEKIEEGEKSDIVETSELFSLIEIIKHFWFMGLITFGGPTAHVALFQERFVKKLKWFDEETFLELFGLCGAMPGPTSTQLIIALATIKGGIFAGILTFLMWSLPVFAIMTAFGVTSNLYNANQPWMQGLGPAATAMVFVAGWQLSKPIVSSKIKSFIAAVSCCVPLLVFGDARVNPTIGMVCFPLVLLFGGIANMLYDYKYKKDKDKETVEKLEHINISPMLGMFFVFTWLVRLF